MKWSARHQPLTFGDLVAVLGVSAHRLRKALATHGVLPAYRVGRIRCYIREQLDAIAELVARS